MAFPTASFTANPASNGPTRSHAAPLRKNAVQRNNRSDAPLQQRTSQKDNPTQLLIKQAVDYLVEQLNAGHSDMLDAYLRTMARFHNYSFGNILQIARQRAVTYCFTSLGSMNICGCASLRTRDGRLVAV